MNLDIRGEVVFEPATDCHPPDCVWVRVLDVTEMDAPARSVSELRIVPPYNVLLTQVGFHVTADLSDASRTYVIAAHLSRAGTRQIRPGDMLTTQSIPVSRTSATGHIKVLARTVR